MNLNTLTKAKLIAICQEQQAEIFELRAQAKPDVPRPKDRASSSSEVLKEMKELALKYKSVVRKGEHGFERYISKSKTWEYIAF